VATSRISLVPMRGLLVHLSSRHGNIEGVHRGLWTSLYAYESVEALRPNFHIHSSQLVSSGMRPSFEI
jgi:hypothetical protein